MARAQGDTVADVGENDLYLRRQVIDLGTWPIDHTHRLAGFDQLADEMDPMKPAPPVTIVRPSMLSSFE